MITYQQLLDLSPENPFDLSEKPLSPPDITVKTQRLLGALIATSEQLIVRSSALAPIIVAEMKDMFLKDTDVQMRNSLSLYDAENGLRNMLTHNITLFPYAQSFYKAVKKNPPRDPITLWEAAYPPPKDPLYKSLDEDDVDLINSAPFPDTKNLDDDLTNTVQSTWGRDSEDWDRAREEKLKAATPTSAQKTKKDFVASSRRDNEEDVGGDGNMTDRRPPLAKPITPSSSIAGASASADTDTDTDAEKFNTKKPRQFDFADSLEQEEASKLLQQVNFLYY